MRRPLASACATTAWVIVANKPFYPLYVWWLVGDHVATSLWTLAAWPLFLAVALGAGARPRAARIALPLVGIADTGFSDLMFGAGTGVEAFFVPCAALAALSFSRDEFWTSRALTAATFVAFAAAHYLTPPGLQPWPDPHRLVDLNLYSAASLTAFVGLRFAAARE